LNGELIELANIIKPYAVLYAVGGCVRDGLLGIKSHDIDVSSKLTVEELKNILAHTDFKVSDRNLRMGTVHVFKGNFSAEYTTFRTDSYPENSGQHSPESVAFTSDIRLDALRRDFKCNAIYLDIAEGKIVDPLGGVRDIENGILSAADEPDSVFGADGLRILRLVRFACELGFEIDTETFSAAKRNAQKVKDIAPERIRGELDRIFISDKTYSEKFSRLDNRNCSEFGIGTSKKEFDKSLSDCESTENAERIDEEEKSDKLIRLENRFSNNEVNFGSENRNRSENGNIKASIGILPHVRGIRLLDELGLIEMLLPELYEIKGLQQPKKYHLYDAFEHSIKAYELAPPELRLAALLHDIGKARAYKANDGANMHGHNEIGAAMADVLLKRLRYPTDFRKKTVALILNHMVDLKGDMSEAKLRRFAAEHAEIIPELCIIKDIDCEASSGLKPTVNRLRDAYNSLLEEKIPLSIKELSVGGADLIALGAKEKERGTLLKELWQETMLNPRLNDREKALAFLEKRIKARKTDD